MTHRVRTLIIAGLLAGCGGAGRKSTAGIDRPAPEFTAKHVDGTTFQFSSLRGRVVVLDIWAAWCDGCEKELPVLDALASRLHPLGAAVVSVSIDEQPEKALEFLRARSWAMTALYDPSGRTGDAYEPPKMPAVFVIDREGVIREARYSLKPDDIAAIEARVRSMLRSEVAPQMRRQDRPSL